MTKEERQEVEDNLMVIARTIASRKQGDRRDIATVGSISALVYAISTEQEQEFAELVLSRFSRPPKMSRPQKAKADKSSGTDGKVSVKASKQKGSKK